MKNLFHSRIVQGLVVLAILACAIYVHPFALVALAPVIFGMALPEATGSDLYRQLAAWGILDPMGGLLLKVKIKTADYTILDPYTTTGTGGDASGTMFTNRGAAGTVNFTLPAPVPRLAGCYYQFAAVVAAQTVLVKTATADTLITFNDLTADSLAIQTAGEIIGTVMIAFCDGTSWIAWGASRLGVTPVTVAT